MRSRKPSQNPGARYFGPRRANGIVVTDAAGNLRVATLGEGLVLGADGVIRVNPAAIGGGGSTPATNPCEPLAYGEAIVFYDGDVVVWCD